MGKSKVIAINQIKNKLARNVTFCKRKKGLIKKAMELSMMCKQEVALYIFDKEKGKLVGYNNTSSFDL